MPDLISLPIIAVAIGVLYLLSVINILPEYERGVIFRVGRLYPEPKGPGLIWVFFPIDRIVRVSLRTITGPDSEFAAAVRRAAHEGPDILLVTGPQTELPLHEAILASTGGRLVIVAVVAPNWR